MGTNLHGKQGEWGIRLVASACCSGGAPRVRRRSSPEAAARYQISMQQDTCKRVDVNVSARLKFVTLGHTLFVSIQHWRHSFSCVALLKECVALLKQCVVLLKECVALLKECVALLKQCVALLKQCVALLKQCVARLDPCVCLQVRPLCCRLHPPGLSLSA